MKKLLLYFILLMSAYNITYGQDINYQKSYSDALAQAGKSNKPVFILINVPLDSLRRSSTPLPNGFNSRLVTDFYNKKFISYKISITDSGATKLRNLYKPAIYPAYIFLDAKGQIIYKAGGNYPQPEKYLDIAKQALASMESRKTISNYEQLDKEGKINRGQLKAYIALREEFGFFDNAVLIDKYIGLLTVNELNTYDEVLFILKAGPYAYGKAYSLIYTDRKMADSIYKNEPLELRKNINSRILTNTRNEAIKTKNFAMAQNVARYTSTTWGKDYKQGSKAAASELIYYYKTVKDTLNYYQQAMYFYDQNYLNITADSAKKLQAKALENIKEAAKANMPKITQKPVKTVITNVNASYSAITVTPTLDVANTLNNAAYDFYTLGTHNINYLVKAMLWSRRSIELNPIPEYYDTLAHIMYRMNFYDEALLNQAKAIELASNTSRPASAIKHLQDEQGKMKSRQL